MEKSLNPSLEQLENGTPSDRIIRLKSVYKLGKTTVQPVSDGLGWYRGIPRLSEEDKRKLKHWAEPETKFVIKDGVTFDLNIESQRITWDWVKHCPCIAMTEEECQFTPGAEYFIYVENEEAAKNVAKKEKKYEAVNCVMNDSPVNYHLRSILLGTDMGTESPVVIKDYLLDIAESAPEKILDIYKSHDLSLRLLLLKAMKNMIVIRDEAGVYRYGNTVLGMSESSAVAWMQDIENKNVVAMLEKEVNPDYFADDEPKKKVTPENSEQEDEKKETKYPINKKKKQDTEE